MLFDPRWKAKEVQDEAWRTMLHEAADALETNGWCQGSLGPLGGARCAYGSIVSLLSKDARWSDATHFRKAVTSLEKFVGGPLPAWNDAPERTKDEVVSTMRLAANS